MTDSFILNLLTWNGLFSEYLDKAKSDIAIVYGEEHPLYSNTVTELLDELKMHEKLKQFKPSKTKNKCLDKCDKIQEVSYDTDRFEDVTHQDLSSTDTHGKMFAGWRVIMLYIKNMY